MISEDNNNRPQSQGIEELLQQAKERDWTTNWRTADLLAEKGAEAVPRLIEALTDADGYLRNAAAIALGKISDSQAVKPLVSAMRFHDDRMYPDNEDSEARMSAATALGRIADPTSYEPLIETLKETLENEVSLSWYIIDALGLLRDKRAIPILQKALEHWDIDVRKAAARALKLTQTNK